MVVVVVGGVGQGITSSLSDPQGICPPPTPRYATAIESSEAYLQEDMHTTAYTLCPHLCVCLYHNSPTSQYTFSPFLLHFSLKVVENLICEAVLTSGVLI